MEVDFKARVVSIDTLASWPSSDKHLTAVKIVVLFSIVQIIHYVLANIKLSGLIFEDLVFIHLCPFSVGHWDSFSLSELGF